ncbi:MAG: prepilin peptidase [Deltaproteobacteria bacterium]|nr:prepilin peptidase [Deltaproteobacteria bacterium]
MGLGLAFAALVFILGASIGSFLNVVIYRLPAGLSIVRPASRCPACETPIRARHNVPVLGWLMLRGRCAACGVAISARYALVELAMGVLALALFADLSGGLLTAELLVSPDFLLDVAGPFVVYLTFLAGLVAITFIDLDWFIIPDGLSLPAIPLGLLASFAAGHAVGVTWVDSLIGAAAGAGVILAVILGYGLLTGREGMGGGDWKLLGAIGAWLGWQGLPFVLFAASIQGIALTLILGRAFAVSELPPDPAGDLVAEPVPDPAAAAPDATADATRFGQLAIPFGPFLALAAIEYLLFREEIRGFLASALSFG